MFSAARYAGQPDVEPNNMPGGIGPVSAATLSACASRDRTIASASNANEIFFHLDNRRVFYDSADSVLYFVDVPGGTVLRTLHAFLAGVDSPATIEQVYLDPHKCFHGASRIRLIAGQANAVLIALRLAGIRTAVR